MIARGLSGAVLWGLFGLLLAVVLLAGSALSKRYAPKVGSGTLLVSAMSVMAGLASATVFSHTYAALFVWLSACGSPCRWSEPGTVAQGYIYSVTPSNLQGRVASLMSVLETGLSALVPLTVGPRPGGPGRAVLRAGPGGHPRGAGRGERRRPAQPRNAVDVEPRLSAAPAQLPGRGSPRSVDTARPPPYPFWIGTANLTGRSVSRGPSRGQCFCFIDEVGARARERSSARSARRAD